MPFVDTKLRLFPEANAASPKTLKLRAKIMSQSKKIKKGDLGMNACRLDRIFAARTGIACLHPSIPLEQVFDAKVNSGSLTHATASLRQEDLRLGLRVEAISEGALSGSRGTSSTQCQLL